MAAPSEETPAIDPGSGPEFGEAKEPGTPGPPAPALAPDQARTPRQGGAPVDAVPADGLPASSVPVDDLPVKAGSGPRRVLGAADLARVAVFAALIAALGLPGTLTFFGSAVPITAQTLGVMLAGALLGARRGALACLVFMALVAAGLPLLAGGRGGLAVFTSPTAGYLIGFPVGAFVIGWLTERILPRYRLSLGILINIVGGIGAVYALGVPVHAWRVDSGLLAVVQGAAQFLPGDLIKAVLAAVIARQVHRAYPGLTRRAGDG